MMVFCHLFMQCIAATLVIEPLSRLGRRKRCTTAAAMLPGLTVVSEDFLPLPCYVSLFGIHKLMHLASIVFVHIYDV